MENLISEANARILRRRYEIPAAERPRDIVSEPQDFDPNHKRSENAATNLAKLFEDVVRCGDILVATNKSPQSAREQIPTNSVFTGD